AALDLLVRWGEGVSRSRSPLATGSVRTTVEICESLRTPQCELNHAVPVMSGTADYPAVQLPVPPYTLGAWLGDGSSWHAAIYSVDPQVMDSIRSEGMRVVDRGVPAGKPNSRVHTYSVTGLPATLRGLGLLSRMPGERRKRIPEVYLRSSPQQRRALLAGLLDTDGTISPTGAVHFDTTSESLAGDVRQLACSLCYRGSISSKAAKLNGQVHGAVYRVSFTTADPVFRLERKANVLAERTVRFTPARNRVRMIASVEPVESVPVRCLTVDSPSSLFCVGENYVPTHNTVCLVGIIAEITRRGWPVWLGDPKRVEFIGLRDWPNVQLVATTVHEQTAMVHRALDVMEYRYACIEAGEADEHSWDPLFVVLDEYRDFFGALRSWYARSKGKGAPSAAPVLEALGSLVRKGRTAGVHFIIGTQRPDSDFFGGEMRDNFHARISLGALSPQGAQMMWEAPHVGVAVPMIKGRGTAISPDEQPVEFQAYWTPDPHPRKLRPGSSDEVLLQSVRPQEDRWEKLAVLPPSAQDVREAASEYMAWAAAPLVAVADHPELAHSVNQAKQLRDKLPTALRSLGPRDSSLADSDHAARPDEQPSNGPGATRGTPVSSVTPAALTSERAVAAAHAFIADHDDQAELGVDDDYQAAEMVIVDELAADVGTLVLVDEATETWGVVESVEPDPLEEDIVCVSWRDVTTGDSSLISVPSGEIVKARRASHGW
ncbi:MAG: LAGLIDADG family homing endonuclease, partial [Dermatophilaceae bacterium]